MPGFSPWWLPQRTKSGLPACFLPVYFKVTLSGGLRCLCPYAIRFASGVGLCSFMLWLWHSDPSSGLQGEPSPCLVHLVHNYSLSHLAFCWSLVVQGHWAQLLEAEDALSPGSLEKPFLQIVTTDLVVPKEESLAVAQMLLRRLEQEQQELQSSSGDGWV